MLIRLGGAGPLHRQVYDAIREGVLSGRLRPGTRLPPSRVLAAELSVSRTVVVQAFERLAAEGFLEGRVGAGTFVREDLPDRPHGGKGPGRAGAALRPADDPGTPDPAPVLSAWSRRVLDEGFGSRERTFRYDPPEDPPWDFRYGRPDEAGFPRDVWRRTLSRVARTPPMRYAHPAGSPALRRSLAGYLARARAVHVDPDRILVTSGSQQALDLVARVALDPGDRVVLEHPHYQGARQTFAGVGARVDLVPVDGGGLRVDRLPADGPPPRLVYVTPSHQFPAGGVMPLGRRLELLAWAGRRETVVLEDDYDSEYRYDSDPVEAVQALDREGRVIYVGTLSKVLFPALRLGYLVLPPAWVEPMRAAKWVADRHSPTLEQETLALFIDEGHFERHLRRSRIANRRRRTALLDALDELLGDRVRVEGISAGVHAVVWLEDLPPHLGRALVEGCRRVGVGVYPVAPYFLEPPPRFGLLLGYAAMDEAAIREGVRRLAGVLDGLRA